MNRIVFTLALAVVFGYGASLPAMAQSTGTAPAQETKKEEPKKDPKIEEYEKAIKDLKRVEGNFNLYQRKKELLLELPEDKLGKVFLFQAAFHTGLMGDGITAGFPADGFGNVAAYKFERSEDTVLLIRPNLRYRWENEDPWKLANERSFPEATLASYRVEQTHPEKKLLLVNITNLFYGDPVRLNEMIMMGLGGPYMLERDKSGPESVKSFADNTVVRMKLHYFNPRPDGGNSLAALLGLGSSSQMEDDRSAPLKVTYNMWWRKESNYRPRVADPRVGYFTTDHFNIGRFYQDDRTERFINRWNLQKKDPKAAVSEPVKPIVWTIDHSVPKQFRNAVREGILYWNRGFEALGFKNAVQVVDAPENDPDYDHADGRRNVVRFTMSEDAGYAIALFRTDPYTGEILNASVNFDANMVSYNFGEYMKQAVPATAQAAVSMLDRAIEALTQKSGAHVHDSNCTADFQIFEPAAVLQRQQFAKVADQFGWKAVGCNYGSAKSESAAYGYKGLLAASAGRPKVSVEQYMNEFVRDVASHEVGHCMGLRHNFISSLRNSVQDLGNDQLIKSRGITTSVMEYTPTNTVAVLRGSGVFFAPRIGEYDMWAIKYGYMDVDGVNTPQGEKFALSRVAGQSGLAQNRYMSDEHADSFDPYVVRFDMAKDPINYSAKNFELARKVRNYAITQMPKPGTSYAERNNLILWSVTRMFREGRLTARFVGGINGNKNFRGDAGESYTLRPVSPTEQRQAMRLITTNLFVPESFSMPESVLMNLTQDHNQDASGSWTAPLRQVIASQQSGLLATLLSASTISRIAENQFKWGANKNAYTIDEHYSMVVGAVFKEVGSAKSIAPLRRDLQRFAVQAMMTQAAAAPNSVQEDARLLASDNLRRLAARYGTASRAKGLDGMTAVYLRETKAQIDRFLSRIATGN